jgi:hypothetical protein
MLQWNQGNSPWAFYYRIYFLRIRNEFYSYQELYGLMIGTLFFSEKNVTYILQQLRWLYDR